MSSLASDLLVDLFPRAGFVWRRGQGSPRILRSDARDATVRHAVVDLLAAEGVLSVGGGKVRKRDAQRHVVCAVANAAAKVNDGEVGLRAGSGTVDFLERSAQFSELSKAIPEDVWVELVYQIARARDEYKRKTPLAQQMGEKDRLTALAHAIDGLLEAAGQHWDWLELEFFAYPHLMGEAVDYEVDEDEDNDEDEAGAEEEEEAGPVRAPVPREEEDVAVDATMADAAKAAQELPSQMGKLTIVDVDGDVEMGM